MPIFKFGDAMYLAVITKEVQEVREIFSNFEIQLNNFSEAAHLESQKYLFELE